eukprot:7281326-Prymnesium_polylepis.1
MGIALAVDKRLLACGSRVVCRPRRRPDARRHLDSWRLVTPAPLTIALRYLAEVTCEAFVVTLSDMMEMRFIQTTEVRSLSRAASAVVHVVCRQLRLRPRSIGSRRPCASNGRPGLPGAVGVVRACVTENQSRESVERTGRSWGDLRCNESPDHRWLAARDDAAAVRRAARDETRARRTP